MTKCASPDCQCKKVKANGIPINEKCTEDLPDCEDPDCEVHCEHLDGFDHGTCLNCGKGCTEDLAARAEDLYERDLDR